jgi:hypothetical protein
MPANVSDPTVSAFIDAINNHDKDAFYAILTPDATMSDDGSDRELRQWADREIFDSHGHLEVESAASRPARPEVKHHELSTAALPRR